MDPNIKDDLRKSSFRNGVRKLRLVRSRLYVRYYYRKKIDSSSALVRVEFAKEVPSNAAIAIGLAFSFVSGQTNNVIASETSGDGRVV